MPVIVVENKHTFRELLNDIHNQLQGLSGALLLSENDQELKVQKSVEMITDFTNININDKKILSKLYVYLKNKTIEEYDNYYNVSERITEYVQQILFDEDYDLVQTGNVDPVDLFKSAGIGFEDVGKDNIERLIQYVSVLENLLEIKLFIFVNVREFFSDFEINNLYDRLLLNKTKFMVVQSKSADFETREKREKVFTFDDDYCEL